MLANLPSDLRCYATHNLATELISKGIICATSLKQNKEMEGPKYTVLSGSCFALVSLEKVALDVM